MPTQEPTFRSDLLFDELSDGVCISDAMDGEIEARSKPGEGSEFIVRLPAAFAEAPP